MKRKRVVVLGATGSIGDSTLKVAHDIPERMEIVGLAANSNAEKLAAAANITRPKAICLVDERKIDILRTRLEYEPKIFAGQNGLREIARLEDADMVLIAIVGTAGLHPALDAIESGKDLAVASKEILVMAGEAVTTAAQKRGVKILPVDSEHNAIFQCLDGRASEVRRIILTASGGPFREMPANRLADVTVEEALKHPTWNMGPKITIDSATMMNKGLELIEAHLLFGLPPEQIEIVVHPQSVIHSMVSYRDGSVLAQLGTPDMRVPISHALGWPARIDGPAERLDFVNLSPLTFERPDSGRFPSLRLAREALVLGGLAPTVLNAANEVAVAAFLARRIGFLDIARIVEDVLAASGTLSGRVESVQQVHAADREARRRAEEAVRSHSLTN